MRKEEAGTGKELVLANGNGVVDNGTVHVEVDDAVMNIEVPAHLAACTHPLGMRGNHTRAQHGASCYVCCVLMRVVCSVHVEVLP